MISTTEAVNMLISHPEPGLITHLEFSFLVKHYGNRRILGEVNREGALKLLEGHSLAFLEIAVGQVVGRWRRDLVTRSWHNGECSKNSLNPTFESCPDADESSR